MLLEQCFHSIQQSSAAATVPAHAAPGAAAPMPGIAGAANSRAQPPGAGPHHFSSSPPFASWPKASLSWAPAGSRRAWN